MSWSRVQGTFAQGGAGTSQSLSFSSSVTTGSIVCGAILCAQDIFVTKVTDDKNNVYDISTGYNGIGLGSNNTIGFFSKGIINNGPTIITVTLNGTSGFIWQIQDEFAAPLGTASVSLDGTSNIFSAPAVNTQFFQNVNSNVLIYEANFSTAASTAASPYTVATGAGTQVTSGYLIQTSPSTANTTNFTATGTNFIVTFGIAPVPVTTWQVVQHFENHTITNGITSKTVSLPNPATPGNFVLIELAPGTDGAGFPSLTSLVDNLGNNYINIVNAGQNPERGLFWSGKLLTNSPQSFTATFSVAQNGILYQVLEVAPPPNTASVFVDTSLANNGTPTAITTSGANEFYYNITEPLVNTPGLAAPTGPINFLEGYLTTWTDIWRVIANPGSVITNWVGGALFSYTAAAFGAVAAPSGSGRQISEEEFNKALAEYSKRSYDELKAASIRIAASNLGKLGGHARAKALSTEARSNIALMGANARWQKR